MQKIQLKRSLRGLFALSALACFSVSAQAPEDLRIALVIGNSAYPGPAALANPINDAKAMAATLKQLGFKVVEVRDGTMGQINESIQKMGLALAGKNGVGMLYYAGHGLQLDWRNYMVPIDARLSRAEDVPLQSVDVNVVINAFKLAGNRMNIVVLDACRDNPFPKSGAAKGLAQLDAPPGTLLAYATAPGNVAEDGDTATGNGLYTQYLLEELRKPTARIEDVFKRVRLNVRKQSQGRQIPWESTSLEEDFYFNSGVAVNAIKAETPSKEVAFSAEKTEWDKIADSTKADDFYTFLSKYPNGYISEQAQFKLEQLQKAQTVIAPNRDGVTPLAPTVRRFELGDERVFDQIDGFTKARTRITVKVTFADDTRAEFNQGRIVWDQSGTLLKNRFGAKSPGILVVPSDIAVGKKFKSAFTNLRPDGVTETNFWEYRVTGYETITVPEGTFKALHMVGKGEATSNGNLTHLTSNDWIDPATLRSVKGERLFRVGGKIVEFSSTESVSFKRGKH